MLKAVRQKNYTLPMIGLIVFLAGVFPIGLWNHDLFLVLNGLHTPWLDVVMGLVSGFGDGLIVVVLIFCVMVFYLRLGVAAISAFFLSGTVTHILKRIFEMPRPPVVFENVHLLGHSLSSLSFPSGHSTSAGVMVVLMFYLWKKTSWMPWTAAALFGLAAFGRVYGGVHFPLDVFVGLAIGMVSMWLCDHWSQSWNVDCWLLSEWSWKIPGMLLLIAAAVLGLGYQVKPITAQPLALILSIAALMLLMKAWKGKINHE